MSQLQTHSDLEQMLHMLSSSSSNPIPFPNSMDKSNSKWKPHIEIAPNCPRCASTNTKFCYYNNYSLSQPRYFCKGCRRYWTKGGSLRNVPVGGGCRKTRRGKVVRNSHTDHLSANGFVDDADDHQHNQNNSRDIDMAVVFAKFLNQNPNKSGDEELEIESKNDPNNNNTGISSSSNNLSPPESGETEMPQNIYFPFDDQFEGAEFLGVVDEDVLWSEISSSNYTNTLQQQQQPMMEIELPTEELELQYTIPCDDQMLPLSVNSSSTNCLNLVSQSWNSWDLSTMEVFTSSSRP